MPGHSLLRESWVTRGLAPAVLCCGLAVSIRGAGAIVQEPRAPQALSVEQTQSAIDQLGALDYEVRTSAARALRRSPAPQVVPALLQAVSDHRDGYVRYRALVLLTAFNDPRTKDSVRDVLASPNDRLRAAAYGYLEYNPDLSTVPELLSALDKELAEFVRPALVRALAAHAADPRVRSVLVREVGRGEDFFRSAVVEALGDYKAGYAFDAIAETAALDGPLLDDAALALGKIGDRRAQPVLAGLQRTAPRTAQPFIATGICLLGVHCDVHERYLAETLGFARQTPGHQELLRGAAGGLAALAISGRESAAETLLDVAPLSGGSTRAPVALAIATVALRNAPLMMSLLERHPRRADAIDLLVEGFDMLEEGLAKERFFVLARRTYWAAKEGSPTRVLMETLIAKLDF